jgi:predicted nuclease with TOPRIM domain
LKAQLDDLAAENSRLKAKTDELADEVARLKSESTKAQELARMRRIEAEAKEKDMQPSTLSGLVFMPKSPIVDLAVCSFL